MKLVEEDILYTLQEFVTSFASCIMAPGNLLMTLFYQYVLLQSKNLKSLLEMFFAPTIFFNSQAARLVVH